MAPTAHGAPPASDLRPGELTRRVLAAHRRILLAGPPGAGKSTLAGELAETLVRQGRACRCIGADPGTPAFGVPGAVCLARRAPGRWQPEAIEALCTLDAGRFRLPLVSAVGRLVQRAGAGTLLLDGPGVTRGVAGAELLAGMVEAAAIEAVLVLRREGRPMALARELAALPVQVYEVRAAAAAARPGKRVRARERTRLWDEYLAGGEQRRLDLEAFHIVGTPPPPEPPSAWVGRQVALLDDGRTNALGEILALDGGVLEVRLGGDAGRARTLLVRDARRMVDGRLRTAERFGADRLEYLPALELADQPPAAAGTGPRVFARVGAVDVALPNGVFGDPLLHIRLRHRRRSLIFDLGEGRRLPARTAHQVTDVFISHAHIDHIAGFLWLLRSRIGTYPVCRMFGPPALAAHIDALTRGILWDRVGDRGPCFEVGELHGERLERFRVQAGRPGAERLAARAAPDGVLLSDPDFRVRAALLEHGTPVLAFALEPARQINIRKDRLAARGLAPGPWLGELKRCLRTGDEEAPVGPPDAPAEPAGRLAADLVLASPGKRLVYATDFADTAENRRRLVGLAHGAHTLFCEASFVEADAARAVRTAHLTARACGEIGQAAGVARLVPFHFSRRYEDDPSAVYQEVVEACPATVTPKAMAPRVRRCRI